jgi:molecular chaperone DnaK (HSP70)
MTAQITSLAPYISLAIVQIIAFVVWIVNLQNKITTMETQIKQMDKELQEHKDNHTWFREQLQKANEALAVAKSVMEGLVLKEMKTKRT